MRRAKEKFLIASLADFFYLVSNKIPQMEVLKQPLSNVQLELLKTFSHQLSESEILELRKILAQFFAQRAIQLANEVWDKQEWTDEDVDRMLETKMRKKSN
jgi:hypothetical protein